jgi:hypothetical protein
MKNMDSLGLIFKQVLFYKIGSISKSLGNK